MKPSELSFKTLCDFFDAVAKAAPKKKALLLRSLLDKNLERNSDDLFEAFRLILPCVGPMPSRALKVLLVLLPSGEGSLEVAHIGPTPSSAAEG